MMNALQKFLLFHVLICLGPNALGAKVVKIIDGEPAPPGSLLFMASVQNSNGKHQCGGSLISDTFVLTAAHCEGISEKVVLGTHDLKNPGTVRDVVQKCKHPSNSDIMLLKLSQAVPEGGSIQHIGLPPQGMKVKDDQVCRVAGWGKTESGEAVDELRFVDVSVVNHDVCEQQWGDMLPADVICAGGFETLKGACHGDSGGPLVCDEMAVGVVSFGDNYCNDPNFPNVYTEVSAFRTWIDQVLSQNGC